MSAALRVHPLDDLARLRAALLPLDSVPGGDAWNLDELDGLLDPAHAFVDAAVLVGLVPRASGILDDWALAITEGDDVHIGMVSIERR